MDLAVLKVGGMIGIAPVCDAPRVRTGDGDRGVNGVVGDWERWRGRTKLVARALILSWDALELGLESCSACSGPSLGVGEGGGDNRPVLEMPRFVQAAAVSICVRGSATLSDSEDSTGQMTMVGEAGVGGSFRFSFSLRFPLTRGGLLFPEAAVGVAMQSRVLVVERWLRRSCWRERRGWWWSRGGYKNVLRAAVLCALRTRSQ